MSKANFKGFFPDDVTGIIDKYLYCKTYFNAAWSHVATPFSIVTNLSAFLVFLKIFGWWNPWTVGVSGVIMFFALLWFGVILFKKDIVQREVLINTRFNPPMQELLKSARKKDNDTKS